MRLIGWCDSFWAAPSPSDVQNIEMLDLLEDMAGNAYSAFHFGPWMMALLVTFGKFYGITASPVHNDESEDGFLGEHVQSDEPLSD